MPPIVNLADVRTLARRRLPRPIFDILDGGAGDEQTLLRNQDGYGAIMFRPRPLMDVRNRDLSVKILGSNASFPVMLAPTGAGRIIDRDAELKVARAARKVGTVYMQSTTCTRPLKEVHEASGETAWFQLYVPPDRADLEGLLARVERAGFRTLAIAIDTAVFGNRERDSHHGVTLPFRPTPKVALECALRPRWTLEFLRGNVGPGVGRVGYAARVNPSPRRMSFSAMQQSILASAYPVTWEDVDFVRSQWKGRLLIKGIMRGDECRQLEDRGVDGFIISNHGGRQLDGVRATVEVLSEIVAATEGRVPVMLDGGIRRGSDVVKALALGAAAVFIGRPYLYGLAAQGEQGVVRVLEILKAEMDRAMALLGCPTVGDLAPDVVDVERLQYL